MIKKDQYKTWIPDRMISKGATAYHDAVAYTAWHKKNIHELITLVKGKIKNNDVIVDFGAGTGSSAIYLLENLKKKFTLLLVDNSPSWLGKAYEILHTRDNVKFLLLEKNQDQYMTLDALLGKEAVDHVISANTVHLIPNIEETFAGVYASLKKRGMFVFQSGNIAFSERDKDILMIDDSINQVHDIALEIIRNDSAFSIYNKDLYQRIEQQKQQRAFVFPHPRSIEYYVSALQAAGFKNPIVTYKQIKVTYADWLRFLRVRRLQAGILPEVGGKDASPQEELDRDALITRAALQLFKRLTIQNSLSNSRSFTAEWTYVHAEK